ncbi:MAG TPA: hypothetical protein VFX59_04925 [Polyangiales bacterium]|nr:hypothetical protein [Polyangiales bacterium]
MTHRKPLSDNQRTFLNNLTREVFQTETSAARHSRREAERYGDAPPAAALRAVAVHAERVLTELPGIAERNELVVSKGGIFVGELFSQGRDKFADLLIDSERSYRGTLLGMRHGVDVFRLLQEFADVANNYELRDFAKAWLEERLPLVQRVDHELRWFAENPDVSVGLHGFLAPRLRSVTRLFVH